jgi:TRAP-type mannitol/chloroaromatic compound transport system substrate-binding protein
MPGLGGEVLRRLGAIVVNVPGGEIVPSLKSGAIDGGEWVGPWLDMALGLHKVTARFRRRPLQENLRELSAVLPVDHRLEQHRRRRAPQQPQACLNR